MKHYINPETKQIFAYEADNSQDEFIPEYLVLLSDEELLVARETQTLEMQQLERERFNSLSYQEKRQLSYPPFTDYLDGIVKGDVTQIQAYIDACQAVKLKYPKV